MYRDQYNRSKDHGEDPEIRPIKSRIILSRQVLKDLANHYDRQDDCPHR